LASKISERGGFRIDNQAIMIEAVKVAENGKSIILRLYECQGGKADGKLDIPFKVKEAYKCNLLEERIEGEKSLKVSNDAGNRSYVFVFLKAFEVQTLCLVVERD